MHRKVAMKISDVMKNLINYRSRANNCRLGRHDATRRDGRRRLESICWKERRSCPEREQKGASFSRDFADGRRNLSGDYTERATRKARFSAANTRHSRPFIGTFIVEIPVGRSILRREFTPFAPSPNPSPIVTPTIDLFVKKKRSERCGRYVVSDSRMRVARVWYDTLSYYCFHWKSHYTLWETYKYHYREFSRLSPAYRLSLTVYR